MPPNEDVQKNMKMKFDTWNMGTSGECQYMDQFKCTWPYDVIHRAAGYRIPCNYRPVGVESPGGATLSAERCTHSSLMHPTRRC